MGSGGTPIIYASMSGQPGGRIMPGTHYGISTAGTGVSQMQLATGDPLPTPFTADYRPNKNRYLVDTAGAPGGGGNNPGYNGGYTDPTYAQHAAEDAAGQGPVYLTGGPVITSSAGSGGGWGAKGGDTYAPDYNTVAGNNPAGDPVYVRFKIAGGAGGKAVQTNGYAVTWLGGSDRAYGAVG